MKFGRVRRKKEEGEWEYWEEAEGGEWEYWEEDEQEEDSKPVVLNPGISIYKVTRTVKMTQ
jgi:hypothetical protein